jgi:hypothetical protein
VLLDTGADGRQVSVQTAVMVVGDVARVERL